MDDMMDFILSTATKPYGLVAWLVTSCIFVANCIFFGIYLLWMRISTWVLNWLIYFILVWWFRLNSVRITIGEFGFLSIKRVKICWHEDDPGLTIEEARLKAIEWNFEKLRDLTIIFDIKRVRRELFTSFEAAKTDLCASLTLHWKMKSPGDILSSDFHNSSDVIPPSFTVLHATDLQITSSLHIERGGSYIAILEVPVVDGLLTPSDKVKSFTLRAKDLKLCCGPYDAKLIQARHEKILEMPVLDFLMMLYTDGPSQFTLCFQGVQISVCPTKVNSILVFVNHLLNQKAKADERPQSAVSERKKSNMEQSLELNIKSEKLKASVCLQDGEEAVSVIASFSVVHRKRNTKSQYTVSVGIQSFVPSRQQQTMDPSVIVGNELISAPWECTLTGSKWEGRSTLARMTSEQRLSVVLRPECVPVFQELREDYMCLLDKAQVNALLTLPMNRNGAQSRIGKEFCVNCKGITLALEMDVYEELLKVSLGDVQAEFNRDQHHVTMELSVQELEIEDFANQVTVFKQRRSGENGSRALLRSSFLQDATGEEGRIDVRRLHAALADSTVSIQETLVLKLLQFAGIKDKSQLRGESTEEEQQEPIFKPPPFLTSTPCFFEKLQVEPFQMIITCTPATDLADELQSLKTALEIPSGIPPLMEKASVRFGEFLRTRVSYKALVSLSRDARGHYMKEVARHCTTLLGSMHIFGNLSSLQGGIAEGLADLKETGDYMGFVRHVRGGLAESYGKFADSWTATIAQSAARTESVPSAWDTTDTSEESSTMRRTMRGVVGSLTSFLLSPSLDASRGTGQLQLSSSPAAPPPLSPSRQLASGRLALTEVEDSDSSESEESNSSCIQSVDDGEIVSRDMRRKHKGEEFLRRLQVSLRGEENKDEKFVSRLKLRHQNPEDKLIALVTNENVRFMKMENGSPTADHVVLTIKLVNLYKARHRDQDGEHYLELLMRVSGGKRLSLPSPNPADSPLVRCSTVEIAQKASKRVKRSSREWINKFTIANLISFTISIIRCWDE